MLQEMQIDHKEVHQHHHEQFPVKRKFVNQKRAEKNTPSQLFRSIYCILEVESSSNNLDNNKNNFCNVLERQKLLELSSKPHTETEKENKDHHVYFSKGKNYDEEKWLRRLIFSGIS